MSRYNNPHIITKNGRAIRALYAVAVVVLLSIFCPKDSTLKLNYTLNEPWESGALIARDSFEIFKTPEVIAKERDSLKRYYEPYYELQASIEEQQIELFKESLSKLPEQLKLSNLDRQELVETLQRYYSKGILPDSSLAILQSQKIGLVHIFKQNESERTTTSDLKTEQMVYQEIMERDEAIRNVLLHIKANRFIVSNLKYDQQKSSTQQREIDQMLTICSGRVLVGEKIVDRGQIITPAIMEKLASYELHEAQRSKTKAEKWSKTGGQILYIALIITALFLYFVQFRRDYLQSPRVMLLIGLLLTFFTILTYGLSKYEFISIYIIPYCILPICLRIFTDSRTAFIAHLCTLLLCAIALEDPYEFLVVETMMGLTAIFSLSELQQRSDLFRSALMVIVTGEVMALCMDLTHMNFFNTQGINLIEYICLAAGGGLLLLSYLLLIPIERLFKFTSSVTLVELSNTNHPILRRLSEEAPGTFQHSMQVSNLAAAIAQHLNAKTQLVRTGALYHDIGKLKNPVFFTENQSGTNPHDKLSCEDSAQIIIQHVKYGLELANKYNLPQCIKDFIATHHGRSKTKFFYITYMNQHPGEDINGEIFTYPGPNPTTLEEAILMMADAVEAASRSLSEYTEESISAFVDRIIDAQVKEGMFSQCPITFENIDKAKQVFKEKLKSIYHTRISYPELKNN